MKNSVTKDDEAAQLRSDKTNTLHQIPVLYNSVFSGKAPKKSNFENGFNRKGTTIN